MRRKSGTAIALLCCIAAPFSIMFAEPAAAAASASGSGWTIVVTPYVWGASLSGDVGLAGIRSPIHVPFSDILHHVRVAAMGNVDIAHGRWGAYVDFQHVRTSQDETVLSLPVNLRAKTNFLTGGLYYKAGQVPLAFRTAFDQPATISFEPMVGLRWTDLRARARIPALGAESSKGVRWTEPIVGIRVNADLAPRWTLFTEIDTGGFGVSSDFSANAQAYLGYRARLLGQPTIIRAGYRIIYEEYEQRDFTGGRFLWHVQQRGPALGLSMIF